LIQKTGGRFMKIKKIISLLLSVTMVAGLFGVISVSADDTVVSSEYPFAYSMSADEINSTGIADGKDPSLLLRPEDARTSVEGVDYKVIDASLNNRMVFNVPDEVKNMNVAMLGIVYSTASEEAANGTFSLFYSDGNNHCSGGLGAATAVHTGGTAIRKEALITFSAENAAKLVGAAALSFYSPANTGYIHEINFYPPHSKGYEYQQDYDPYTPDRFIDANYNGVNPRKNDAKNISNMMYTPTTTIFSQYSLEFGSEGVSYINVTYKSDKAVPFAVVAENNNNNTDLGLTGDFNIVPGTTNLPNTNGELKTYAVAIGQEARNKLTAEKGQTKKTSLRFQLMSGVTYDSFEFLKVNEPPNFQTQFDPYTTFSAAQVADASLKSTVFTHLPGNGKLCQPSDIDWVTYKNMQFTKGAAAVEITHYGNEPYNADPSDPTLLMRKGDKNGEVFAQIVPVKNDGGKYAERTDLYEIQVPEIVSGTMDVTLDFTGRFSDTISIKFIPGTAAGTAMGLDKAYQTSGLEAGAEVLEVTADNANVSATYGVSIPSSKKAANITLNAKVTEETEANIKYNGETIASQKLTPGEGNYVFDLSDSELSGGKLITVELSGGAAVVNTVTVASDFVKVQLGTLNYSKAVNADGTEASMDVSNGYFEAGTGSDAGKWNDSQAIVWEDVDFGNVSSLKEITFNYITGINQNGGTYRVRIDGLDGDIIAEVQVVQTQKPYGEATAIAPVMADVTGVHDIYLEKYKYDAIDNTVYSNFYSMTISKLTSAETYNTYIEKIDDIAWVDKDPDPEIDNYGFADPVTEAVKVKTIFEKPDNMPVDSKIMTLIGVYDLNGKLIKTDAVNIVVKNGINTAEIIMDKTDLTAGNYTVKGFLWNGMNFEPLKTLGENCVIANFTVVDEQ
jgi:hypothetical protein